MKHIKKLRDEFLRGGAGDEEHMHKARVDTVGTYHLQRAVGVRTNVMRVEYPIDHGRLRQVREAVWNAPLSAKRLGDAWTPRTTQPIRKVEQNWASHVDLLPLNDVCTGFCTDMYFPRSFERATMVMNVLRLFSEVNRHGERGVMFKGGVALRFIVLEFLHCLPVEARIRAVEYMRRNGALGVSDFDFEIVRPQGREGTDADTQRIMLENFAVLLWFMRTLSLEVRARQGGGASLQSQRLLNTRWRHDSVRDDLHRRLQAAVDKLDEGHVLHGSRIDHVVLGDDVPDAMYEKVNGHRSKDGSWRPKRRDSVAVFKCNRERCAVRARDLFEELGLPGVDSGCASPFYATCNLFIGEDEFATRKYGEQKGTIFHLTRIKHAFVVYYTTASKERRCDRLAGEMVDLSMTDRRDEFRAFMYDSVRRSGVEMYQDYLMMGVPGPGMKSLSSHGFLYDLEKMLHYESERLFEGGPKYAKRVLRYLTFLIIVTLGPLTAGTQAKKYAALHALVRHTSSVALLLNGPPLYTGVPPVDYYAARERKTLLEMSQRSDASKVEAYVATLHRHAQAMVPLVTADYDEERPEVRLLPREMSSLRRHTRTDL